MDAKPSTAIDKSVFQRICEEPPDASARIWKVLFEKCQLVIPIVMVEEVMANVAKGQNDRAVVERMAEQIVRLQPCWMDDVFEIAFRELVRREHLTTLPAPDPEFVRRVLNVKKGDPEFLRWAAERRELKKESARERITGQNVLLSAGQFKEVGSEKEFFQRMLGTLRNILADPQKKREMLETILGSMIRPRHRHESALIDQAFEQYGPETFTSYPLMLNCWVVRMFYVYAPLVKIRSGKELRKILGRSLQDQCNNPEDEQYVISALACNQLLTADAGMRNIMRVFEDGQFTNCKTLFVDRAGPLESQILALLN